MLYSQPGGEADRGACGAGLTTGAYGGPGGSKGVAAGREACWTRRTAAFLGAAAVSCQK